MKHKTDSSKIDWKQGKVNGFLGKDLLNIEQGTVKLVKVLPNSSYPEHIHPNKTEFAFVQQGNPEFFIGSEHFEGKEGDFFVFPAKEQHAILNSTNDTCILLIGAFNIS